MRKMFAILMTVAGLGLAGLAAADAPKPSDQI